jgi:3-oxoacyl-[acyl-carrier protein] reductase
VSEVVVITGAAGGIGRVLSLAAAAAGYAVVAADIASTAEVVGEIEGRGGEALGAAVDVTEPGSTRALAAAALERFGRIDGLVNNAAHYTAIEKRPFDEIDVGEWDRCFAVNVRGAWLCAAAVAPAMRRAGRGKIVNVSSMTVPTAPPGFAHYVASKAAIVGLTRALARELGGHGVCVNTLTPDYIAFDRDYDRRQPEMAELLTAQRCFRRAAEAEDLVGSVLYLLGPGSDFVTGQNIWVNGGRAFS